jgi:thioredoxin reductase (NADPH)
MPNAPESSSATLDCLIVGGGPAGLTAAVYLARFRRTVVVADCRTSRARYIPRSHNCPGFASGIRGKDLLANLRRQARQFGARIVERRVTSIVKRSKGFEVRMGHVRHQARTLIVATGIQDILPRVEGIENAIFRGLVRLCPICDGYEASTKRIAVYGPPDNVISHARFLRSYSHQVSAVLSGQGSLSAADRRIAESLQIPIIPFPNRLVIERRVCRVQCRGSERVFDFLYPCLGFKPKSQLSVALGARADRTGELIVNAHMQTTVPGLYGVGDAVGGLHQICVAAGHAAIAATAIHNRLEGNPE